MCATAADDPLGAGATLRGDEPVKPGEPSPFSFDFADIPRKVDPWEPTWVIEKYFVPDPDYDPAEPR